MPDLTALLEKLKVVDQETWKQIDVGKANRLPEFDISQDIIQGCIQRATEARGWRYYQSLHYLAGEQKIYYSDLRDHDNYDISKGDNRDSPAEALLSSYLKAIEGKK